MQMQSKGKYMYESIGPKYTVEQCFIATLHLEAIKLLQALYVFSEHHIFTLYLHISVSEIYCTRFYTVLY